jgi:hypothetical protein
VRQIIKTLLILTGLTAAALQGQVSSNDSIFSFGFSYFVNPIPLATQVAQQNGFIAFPDTSVGKSSSITFTVTSGSMNTYLVANAAVIDYNVPAAQSAFSLRSATANLPPLGVAQLTMTFAPNAATPQKDSAAFMFNLLGANGQNFYVVINVFANALQSQLTVSYVDAATGNQLPLTNGSVIQFPKTAIGSTSVSQIVVVNNGSGSGTFDSISLTGSSVFTLTSEPLLPLTIAAGKSAMAGITFTPLAIQDYKATLTVSVGGVSSSYAIDGNGANSLFSYNILTVAGSTPVQPNANITLPDTPADGVSKNTVTVQVKNTGNLPGIIPAILSVGTDFQLANLPVLPLTLKPGDLTVFNVIFQPAKAGTSSGRLQIGNDLFSLTGSALGSMLSLAIDVGLGPTAVANKALVSMPNTTVGDKRSAYINVTNTGNLPAVISGIGVSGTGFTIPTLPPIPATLSPSQTIQFQVQYMPMTVSTVTGAVTINDQTLTLLGVGQAPPMLPTVSFTNLPANLSPLQQPSVGLQLAAAYPYDLKGTLTLSFLSDSFVDDPAIQFATGGRTINFIIPANATQATFLQASGAVFGTLAPFQTGTVSGTVTVSAAGFLVGQVDITPTAASPSRSAAIPAGPPQLRSVRVDSILNNQIVLLVSGYSTPRNLSSLNFQLTGVSGANLQTSSVTVDVSGAFTSWYSSAASDIFGSQFTVSVTLTITGDVNAIQSIAVTATNSKGTSAPQTVTLR